MAHFSSLLLIFLIVQVSFSQKKWDGGGGTSNWNNALNWTGNTVPASTDNVLLDNSIITSNYTVVLPSTFVTVRTITITPAASRSIQLTLPSTNTLTPGFSATGPGYGMTLNGGAVFRNSSGAASGIAVNITDSIRINNNARYIHNSAGAHSSNIQRLSATGGTESGTFEFDMPTASSTISLSGRIFGKLILNSAAAGGVKNYIAAGTSRVRIRGDLQIGAGVNLSLNFLDTIFIHGNFSQQSGTFNLGTAPRPVVVFIEKNFTQTPGAVITETGTGIQTIAMGGAGLQLMSPNGTWNNQVALVKTGQGAVIMKNPLSLPYKLVLKSGRIITTDTWLLTLQSSCEVETDSLDAGGFIDGPLKKDGLSNSGFLFPVGENNQKRWIYLDQATGNFKVDYLKINPQTLSNTKGTGIDHVSSIEYWNINAASAATAKVRLSFIDPHSGGVTDLSSLRVARLVSGKWENVGQSSHAGTAGSNGWVSSTTASGFSASTQSFALASAISQENPLPIFGIMLKADYNNGSLHFVWSLNNPDMQPDTFELQQSSDGLKFETVTTFAADTRQKIYTMSLYPEAVAKYYRIRFRYLHGTTWHESTPVKINSADENNMVIRGSNVVHESLNILFSSKEHGYVKLVVCDSEGKMLLVRNQVLNKGRTSVYINVSGLKKGIYYLHASERFSFNRIVKFVKVY